MPRGAGWKRPFAAASQPRAAVEEDLCAAYLTYTCASQPAPAQRSGGGIASMPDASIKALFLSLIVCPLASLSHGSVDERVRRAGRPSSDTKRAADPPPANGAFCT
ncbi:hypothetical protein LX36DRAFT_662461 [Colletotrichum falcatum]|nr:hypothetical protein LX36DRAFT_662461 [Colletotrichum falcatum]